MARKYTKSYRRSSSAKRGRLGPVAFGEPKEREERPRDDGLCLTCGCKREEVMTVPYCYACNRERLHGKPVTEAESPAQTRQRDILYALENEPVTQGQAVALIEELAEIQAKSWDWTPMPEMPEIDTEGVDEIPF